VLGMLLVKATGRSITDYRQEKLYTPLGSVYPETFNLLKYKEIFSQGIKKSS
jgi:hypothetical protein